MQRTIQAFIYRGETHYVAECAGISVVTQGRTLDETVANLRESVALYLEDRDTSESWLAPDPAIVVTMEVEPSAIRTARLQ
ncbi:MAG: type II toxin-antitoxin system HicB family antitoxin [bacterium]